MDKHIIQLFWEVPIIFMALLILTRLQGKKQISHLTYFDYITGVTLGDVSAGVLVDENIPLGRTLVAIALLAGFSIMASYLTTKSRKLRIITEGEPIVVIKQGKILENNLRRMRLDIDNLRMLLRKKNVFAFADVEFAVMETDGSLSILKKAEQDFPTRKDLGLLANEAKPGIELIIDGVLDQEKLEEAGLTMDWLLRLIRQNGLQRIEDVCYLEITGEGKIYIDFYDDQIRKKQDENEKASKPSHS
jgi:uncharacterized membrane protein YcaP (DUF421 family)